MAALTCVAAFCIPSRIWVFKTASRLSNTLYGSAHGLAHIVDVFGIGRSDVVVLWMGMRGLHLLEGPYRGDGPVQLEREERLIAGAAAVGFASVEMILHALYVVGTRVFVALQEPGTLLRVLIILASCAVSKRMMKENDAMYWWLVPEDMCSIRCCRRKRSRGPHSKDCH